MGLFRILAMMLRAVFGNWTNLAAENLALRRQLSVLQRSVATASNATQILHLIRFGDIDDSLIT
jgi:hypothetical protein